MGRRRGWRVLTVTGAGAPYDLVYDVSGSLLKIQVKTAQRTGTRVKCVDLQRVVGNRSTGTRRKKSYKPTDFDFLIGVDHNDFWIIPMQDVKGRSSISFGPSAVQYRNAWHLIEQEAARRGSQAITGAAYEAEVQEVFDQVTEAAQKAAEAVLG